MKDPSAKINFEGSQELIKGLLCSGQARMFGDNPGQQITETVTECVYDNTGEGMNKLKYAYVAVHHNKNDPMRGNGRKMKKAIRTASACHYNHSIGTRLYKHISDCKSKPFLPFFDKLSKQSLQTNDSHTIIKHIKILAKDEMIYIPPPTTCQLPKINSQPKK